MARWSFKGLAPIILVIGAACATPGDVDQSTANENASIAFFSEAYGHIDNHYVRKVELRDLVINGLTALNQVDNKISLREQKGQGRLTLFYGNEARSQLPLPQDESAAPWAGFTVDVIEAARQASPALSETPTEKVYETVIDAMIGRLDMFSRYSTAEEARNTRAVREGYTGLGISVREADEGIRIMRVYRNTPAEAAGLRRNDVITRIEGDDLAGQDLPTVVNRLKGPEGSSVTITIARNDAAPFDVSVKRERVTPIMVEYRREGNVAYIAIERFTTRTSQNVEKAVRRAQAEIGPGIRGYILDLRDNPGGLLFESIRVSDLFMDGGRIVSTQGRHPDSQQNYFARVGDLTHGAPVVVLINGRSASASEIVASALQDSSRAIVIGSNSFGKGTVQSEVDLPNGGALSITWSRFHAPSGYALHELGVLPNVCTSAAGQSSGRIMARLRTGATATRSYFERWRTTPLENHEERAELRRVCPAVVDESDTEADSEMALAKRLIKQRGLYQAALSASRPVVASRGARQDSARP